MSNMLREAVVQKKNALIKKLISLGVYKKDDKHLFELTLTELQDEYSFLVKNKREQV